MIEPDTQILVHRVPVIRGGASIDHGFLGIDVRWSISKEHCEMRVTVWFTVKVGFSSIRMSSMSEWMGCDECLNVAKALALKFAVEQLEVCDPDILLTEERIFEFFPTATMKTT